MSQVAWHSTGDKAVDVTDIILALLECPFLWSTHKNTDCEIWGDDCWDREVQDAGRALTRAPNSDFGVQGKLCKGSDEGDFKCLITRETKKEHMRDVCSGTCQGIGLESLWWLLLPEVLRL